MAPPTTENLAHSLDRAAERMPHHPAIVENGEAISYGELARRAVEAGEELAGHGVRPGQRIGLRLPNGTLYIALTYGIWRCGATVVPIATELKAPEIEAICESMGLAGTIDEDKSAASESGWSFASIQAGALPEGETMDLAFVRFTSGTTGRHKGVALSHESIQGRIDAANRALEIGPEDRVLWVLPMAYHFVVTIVLYLDRGATIILPRGTLAGALVKAAKQSKPTIVYAAPFHYRMLAGAELGDGLGEVRLALSTAMGLPADVHEAFKKSTGISAVQAYGIIELGLACINLDDPGARPGSVGRPLPDFEIRLRDGSTDESGAEVGEVLVRGPGFFDAYCAPWTPRNQVCQNGWFATGDLGRIDDEGRLELVGRTKEVIISAGMKVFPSEVEAVLNAHPGIAETRVFGREHARFGQIVEAEVVAEANMEAPTPGEILRRAKDSLAPYKLPVAIRIVESIAKTASGKIARGS